MISKYFCLFIILLVMQNCGITHTPEISLDQLEFATASQLAEWINDGSLTCEELTQYYLARIDSLDQGEGGYKSVITLNPDAITIAKSLDIELKEGKKRGPLHGIPILIKDNIDTHDKMPNTAGSVLFEDNFPREDAFIVNKLRAQGLVIIGKTNLSEWANFRSTNSSSGWSSKGGQTGNAYNKSKSPCGSSAGSGVAVSLGLSPLAIGTETDGSIVCPSSINGIVGIKPTVGLWSRSGIIPISKIQDTAGPMALSVKDAASLLGLLLGVDPSDEYSFDASVDYTKYCVEGGLKGKRIGVDSTFMNIEGELGEIFNKAISDLEVAGATIVIVSYRDISKVGEAEYEVLLYEFKDGLNQYLSKAAGKYRNLEEVINANESMKEKTMPIFGQEIFTMAQAKGDLTEGAYLNAIKESKIRSGFVIDSVLNHHQLDVLVGPTLGQAWDIDHINGDSFNGPSSYSIASRAGYPHLSIPMGFVEGLPVGISFIGRSKSEPILITCGYDYEQKTKARRHPGR